MMFRILLASALTVACFSSARADSTYETDKQAALAAFGPQQKTECLRTLDDRYQQRFTLSGDLAFDDKVSQTIYDSLFWKGDKQRGLAFVAPVNDTSARKPGALMCYYAMQNNSIELQNAFVLPFPPQKTADFSQ